MVLYFPATGNTEFIAKEIAKRLNTAPLHRKRDPIISTSIATLLRI